MKKAVFFDFDGTIADSSEGIMECALKTVQPLGYDTSIYSKEYLRRFIGPPLSDCFRITFSVPEEKIPECVERYRVFYNEKGMYMMHVYPEIPALLKTLRSMGIKTAVSTNKMKELAERCCHNLDIYDLFDYISGPPKDGGVTKAQVITLASEALGLNKEDILMVGDTVNDEKGAQESGVDFLPVTWGFGFTKENCNNDKRADQPMDILKHIGGEN
ncbi:MAG: HAD hydrolase-like protein [Spirochaetales bacterium]|nr:HAD hydrolase-like protein [Spirochaetales bacterium]